MKSEVILNLGCGATKIPNSIGVDSVALDGFVDLVHDLNVEPYPFEDNYADEIHFYHVLEHLQQPLKKLEEIHRILKPGGILYMRIPHFSSMGAFSDLTHIKPFGYTSFDCFEKDKYHHFYTKAIFEIKKKRIKYFGLYPNSGVYAKYIHANQCFWAVKPLVRLINFFIDLSPTFFERVWCYWVGGANEIEIIMEKPQ